MNRDELTKHVGKMVMSRDAGHLMIKAVPLAHGPYLLIRITNGGKAVIRRWSRHDLTVNASLISAAPIDEA